jgi:hypothetical protein
VPLTTAADVAMYFGSTTSAAVLNAYMRRVAESEYEAQEDVFHGIGWLGVEKQ